MKALSVLQVESRELAGFGNKKKLNKALAAFPCGFINVEEVASVALRLLRVNSTTSPKQVRADKRSYDELIQVNLQDLHFLAWKIISFLFKNVEIGTEVFERELATLTRDQIKSDMKTSEKLGKGSERALDQFIELAKLSSSFNGQVFVNEIVRSGVLIEISSKKTQKFSTLLRSGGFEKENNNSNSSKKARYHQISESDQKRLENAQKAFCSELEKVFTTLSRNFTVFESVQSHLSPQEHISLTENLLTAILVLFQSQHNFKFVSEIFEGEYLRILVDSLAFALVSFQPAYLPPFLPIAMRILNLIAGKSDASGLSARRALLQVELMIHPRRLGPVTFRPASEAMVKVFERPEVVTEVVETKEAQVVEVPQVVESPVVAVSNKAKIEESTDAEVKETKEDDILEPVNEEIVMIKNHKVPVPLKQENLIADFSKEEPPIILQSKRTFDSVVDDEDDDDLPLPQIVDSGPDDN